MTSPSSASPHSPPSPPVSVPPAPPASVPPTPPATAFSNEGGPAPRSATAGRPVSYGPLRGVYLKELRENLKYAFGAFALLGVFALFALWDATRGFERIIDENSALFCQDLTVLSAFACPICGLMLAAFQVFNERSFDLRAFAWHRAMTPTRLFWAKCLAGLTLYTCVLAPPMLLLIAYAASARSGGLVFDIHFTQGYQADFLSGIVYYFAGFLAAQRQARWYVSKLVPMPAALAVSACSFTLPEFWQAVLATVMLGAVIAVAAWHTFIHGGVDVAVGQTAASEDGLGSGRTSLRRARRWATPAVIALGLTTAGTALLLVDAGVVQLLDWEHRLPGPNYAAPLPAEYRAEQYRLLPDGTPARYIVERRRLATPDQDGRAYDTTVTWIDMQGRTVSKMELSATEAPTTAPQEQDGQTYFGDTRIREPRSYREPAAQFTSMTEGDRSTLAGAPGAERWYYLHANRYFIGYDMPTGKLIGTVGRNGFLPAGQSPQPFAPSSHLLHGYSVTEGPTVYRTVFTTDVIRPALHDVIPFFSAPSGEAILDIGYVEATAANEHSIFVSRGWNLFLTKDHIYFRDRAAAVSSAPQFAIPLEHSPRDFQINLRYHWHAHRISLWYVPVGQRPIETQYVSTYTDRGELVANYTLPPLPAPLQPELNSLDRAGFTLIGVIDSFRNPLAVDLIQRACVRLMTGSSHYYHDFLSWMVFTHGDMPMPTEYLAGIIVPMLLAAAFTLFLARRQRYSPAGTAVWTLAALLIGPLGLFTFLFTQPLSRRIKCLNCGKKRLVSRAICEHCAAPFPPPARNGTEVFG